MKTVGMIPKVVYISLSILLTNGLSLAQPAAVSNPASVLATDKGKGPPAENISQGTAQPSESIQRKERIYAEPLGSDGFSGWIESDQDLYLLINNEKDRVGARFRNCRSLTGDWPQECPDELTFLFPQLRLDESKKSVLMGSEVVAKLGRFSPEAQLSKDFRLQYEIATKTEDTGFDRHRIKVVRIYLERKPGKKVKTQPIGASYPRWEADHGPIGKGFGNPLICEGY